MEQQSCREEIKESENPLQGGTNQQGEKMSEKTCRETLKSLNQQTKTKDDAEAAMISRLEGSMQKKC